MKNIFLKFLILLPLIYLIACGLIYIFQENLIFFPEKLDKSYQFSFNQEFKEINIEATDGISLNGLLFKADNSKGLIFYLHGNAGSIKSWGQVAKTYTDLDYDIFILDYRGYGKSEGEIAGEEQLFQDLQTVYDRLKENYSENHIIILGYSIGTGLASKIASTNSPKLLILQAPYYSLTDLVKHIFPIVPTSILKYKFKTNEYLTGSKMPIVIFHGDQDEVIYHGSSIKLKEQFERKITLITLKGQGHNGMTDNPDYQSELQRILNR